MDKTIILEIPQEEATQFEAQLAKLLQQMQEVFDEHEARQSRIAQLRAESEQSLAAIRRSLANVEKYHSATNVPFRLQ